MAADFTVGMACFRDFDGVYFTVEALKIYHADRVGQIVVVDDSPDGPDQIRLMNWCRGLSKVKYVRSHVHGTSAPRNRVFAEADLSKVVCVDSHVLIHPGSFEALDEFWSATDGRGIRLAHGVLMQDDNRVPLSAFRDEWGSDLMHGKWHTDHDQFPLVIDRHTGTKSFASDDTGRPISVAKWRGVWSQGLGGFACVRDEWPGFHPGFSEFGGEEGYIDDKFRRMGGLAVSVSGFRWTHRFHDRDVKTSASSYTRSVAAKFRNYVLGRRDNALPTDDVVAVYSKPGHPAKSWESGVDREIAGKPPSDNRPVTVTEPKKKCGSCGSGGSREVAEKWSDAMSQNAEMAGLINAVKSVAAGKHVWIGPAAYAGQLGSAACVAAVAVDALSVTVSAPNQDDVTKNWLATAVKMLPDKVAVTGRDVWPGQAVVVSPVGLPDAVKQYTHEISKSGNSWVVSQRSTEPKRIPLPLSDASAAAVAASYPDHAVTTDPLGKRELVPVWELDPTVKVLPGRMRMAANYLKFLTSDREHADPEVSKERMDKCWLCPNRKPVLYPDQNWYQRCVDTPEAKGCGCFLDWSPPNPSNDTQAQPGKVAYRDQACPRGFW